MKFFVFVFGVCFVQMCLSAPITSEEAEEAMDDSKLITLTRQLKLNGMDDSSINSFVDAVRRTGDISNLDTMVEAYFDLLSVAVQGDEKCKKMIDLKRLLDKSKGEEHLPVENVGNPTSSLTDFDLNELEAKMAKELTPKQLEHAMKIFRSFREGTTSAEHEEAGTDLMFSAVKSLMMKGCKMP